MLHLSLEFYYSERIQIRTSQRKRLVEKNLWRRRIKTWSFHILRNMLPSWHHRVAIHMEYCQPRKLTWALVSRVLLGLDHILLVWLTCSLQLLWRSELIWPVQSTSPFITLLDCLMGKAHRQTKTLIRQDIPGRTSKQVRGQTSLRGKLIPQHTLHYLYFGIHVCQGLSAPCGCHCRALFINIYWFTSLSGHNVGLCFLTPFEDRYGLMTCLSWRNASGSGEQAEALEVNVRFITYPFSHLRNCGNTCWDGGSICLGPRVPRKNKCFVPKPCWTWSVSEK